MEYDLLIKNGRVVDGTGNPWFKADVAVRTGKVVKIGKLDTSRAAKVIDARGFIVAPGFIDVHSHSDFTILSNPTAESKVRQGVTTEVNGNCGNSAAPLLGEALGIVQSSIPEDVEVSWSNFREYYALLERTGISVNIASLVGHSTIRLCVMGMENRKPSAEEMRKMQSLVEQAMLEGAIGISSGLDKGLVPGCYAERAELVELAKVVAGYGGFYATHIRNRQERVLEAAKEAVEIGVESGIPVHISHFVPRFPDGDKTLLCIGMIEAARKNGFDVTCDAVIPNARDGYHWANGSLATQVLPLWAYEGGVERLLKRLGDPETRRRMREDAEPLWGIWREGWWDKLILHTSRGSPEFVGKTFEEIARIKGVDPWDAAYDIILMESGRDCSILGPSTEEKDSLAFMRYPWCSLESDRAVHAPYGSLGKVWADANSYGAFPRVFQRYVRGLGILTLEDAVRKMTSLPAQRCGFQGRGIVREGCWADLVVFDLEKVRDRATIEEPARYPEGIEYVIVNGKIVVEGGEHTGAKPGRVLRSRVS
ncbi:MAG: D-aminoacylase [Candidatus Bathyarchaeia archaeon]